MRPVVEIDAVIEFGEINDALWHALERIAPFGMGNRRPLFGREERPTGGSAAGLEGETYPAGGAGRAGGR